MVAGSSYQPPPVFDPARHSRAELLRFVRQHAPDLRIGHAIVEGQRVAFARFTFGPETYAREAHGDGADDDLARTCAAVVARLLGMPTAVDRAATNKLEQDVLQAAYAGDTARADALGLELARTNSGEAPAWRGRTSFQR